MEVINENLALDVRVRRPARRCRWSCLRSRRIPTTATIQSPALAQQPAAGQQRKGEYGTWPHHWTKADESAATDALNDLEVHDYARFSNFHKKGDDFEATVMKGSKAMQVLIDPAKGTVTLES